MRARSGARNDRGNPIGAAIARLASLGTLALGHVLWIVLRIAYRGDSRLVAGTACVCIASGVTLWMVVT
ncbi:hypothetical protein [uncultured Sphingomonas sp.]|uniref:hypothetical protein n=1 Tax=uncultured Sphingomonas sp. TaxID=158754 RepID=UPI0025EDAD73|nr:hypothetical protein [uncultured Sphingomonas sp.]